ncbi:MAG: acriflavin resistance protein [Labilithrix sp.]|nr:acriflavin resistance protein [Labilithrix sp.]
MALESQRADRPNMWIVRLALRRPFTVAAFCLVILLMGVLSGTTMPVDLFPAIDIPVVVVVWNYPGMSAEDMERRMTLVSERGISTSVSGVTRIDSQTISGTAVLRVYFEPQADIGGAIAQISAASLSAARIMPPGTQPPVLLRYNASNVPVAQLTLSGDIGEQEIFDYGLNFLRIRLFTVPGLSTPAPYGGKQRQMMVQLDPARAAAKGVSPQDVVNAVLAGNVILPAGSARLGRTEYDVLLNGSPSTQADFAAIPVKVVSGATVYLGDVASVYDGFAVQTNMVRVDGRRASYLAILKKENASTLAVVDATRDMLPALRAAAPTGLDLKLEFDQSAFVRGAVKGVVREAIIAAVLVALMILAFVGSWRSTIIVCISIPVSILVGIIGLKLSGQTLNLMTLGGLALAIGMLVDDATVAIENINSNRAEDKPILRAILVGAHQVAQPALAATFTICIVFFPVVLLSGPARYLFVPLALSVVFAMMASYLLSRTLVPTLSAMLLGKERLEHEVDTTTLFGRVEAKRQRAFNSLRDGYADLLTHVLRRRMFVLAVALGLLFGSGLLLSVVGLDFFPQVDAGVMRLHFRAPAGTRIEETERLVDEVEHEIRDIVPPGELRTIDDNIGVPLSYNLGFVPSDNVDGADAEILVALAEGHRPTREYMQRIRSDVRQRHPGSTIYFMQADIVGQVLNFGLSAPIDVQIESQDWRAALPIAVRLERSLAVIPGTEDVRLAQVLDHPSLRVDVDRERAAQLGLTERDVASSMLTSLASSSLVSPSFWINPQNNVNYFVVVQTPIERITKLSDVMTTPVTPSGGALFETTARGPTIAPYVGAVANVKTAESRAVVNHVTVQPVLDVQCNVEGRDLGAVMRDIDRAVRDLGPLPNGVNIHVRGQGETMFTAFERLGLGMLVAITLVYLLLVVLFQSWLDPFLIMLAVPGALSGILWFLVATQTTLNVESFMGAIMAIGIAASNSILLVSFANAARIEDESLDPVTAACRAAETRLRPVLMTALAMILGMLPMALGLGEGGEQNVPLGRAVIGGLLVSTPVTLLIVPSAYAVLRKKVPEVGHRDRAVHEAQAEVPT